MSENHVETTHLGAEIPEPPTPPEDYECCNSGCEDNCVYEIYKREKAEYDAKWGSVGK